MNARGILRSPKSFQRKDAKARSRKAYIDPRHPMLMFPTIQKMLRAFASLRLCAFSRSASESGWRAGLPFFSRILCLFAAIILPTTAHAQRTSRVRALPEKTLPFVSTCIAPEARFAAVCDAANTLVVGHRPKSPVQLSIFKLDDQGQVVAGDPVTLTLPKPATLADKPNFVLGVACHPRFPLAYVWQDVQAPEAPLVIDPALAVEFDHLFIYSLEESPPKLLLATCRGDAYHCGANNGGFALDAANNRLYVPNLQQSQQMGTMKKMVAAAGWITLDPDGLPAFVDPAAPAPTTTTGATAPVMLEPPAAAASRATRLAAFEAAKAAGTPLAPKLYSETAAYAFSDWPNPFGYTPLGPNAVMLSGYNGPISWVLTDRLGRLGYYFISPYVPYRYRIAAHPTLPLIYVTIVTYDSRIIRLEHADGYITLMPHTFSIDNLVIHSPPLYLAKTNQLAIGTVGRVCVVDLDDQGRIQPQGAGMTVNNPAIEALAWSEKFGRLYVPVEKTP